MVFLLIIIGVLLVLLNIKAIKKEENSFSSILKREESTTNRDYDAHIIAIRKDLAESILDIQKEMEEIKVSITNIKKDSGNVEEKLEVDDSINEIINEIINDSMPKDIIDVEKEKNESVIFNIDEGVV
ncbi:MAG: hypothetical protein ACRDA5_11615, partial [Clostridium sp.]